MRRIASLALVLAAMVALTAWIVGEPPGVAAAAPGGGVYEILVDTDTSELKLYRDRMLVKEYPVAVGKPSDPTPAGSYYITSKIKYPGGALGTRWIGLSAPHIGIHGTNDPDSIGKHASQGCIRMRNEDIEELFFLVPMWTKVYIF